MDKKDGQDCFFYLDPLPPTGIRDQSFNTPWLNPLAAYPTGYGDGGLKGNRGMARNLSARRRRLRALQPTLRLALWAMQNDHSDKFGIQTWIKRMDGIAFFILKILYI